MVYQIISDIFCLRRYININVYVYIHTHIYICYIYYVIYNINIYIYIINIYIYILIHQNVFPVTMFFCYKKSYLYWPSYYYFHTFKHICIFFLNAFCTVLYVVLLSARFSYAFYDEYFYQHFWRCVMKMYFHCQATSYAIILHHPRQIKLQFLLPLFRRLF